MTMGLIEIKILSIHLFEGFPRALFLLCTPEVHAFQSIIPTFKEVNLQVTFKWFLLEHERFKDLSLLRE